MRIASGALLLVCSALPAQQVLQNMTHLDFNRRFTPMGDRNGDGFEDVLVVSMIFVGPSWNIYDDEVRLYSGRDGSLLRRGPRWAYPDQAEVFPAGDHDGDGIRDYICLDSDQSNFFRRLSVRSGRDDHVFWAVQHPFTYEWAYHVIGDLDVDGDGHPDVVASNPGGSSGMGEIWAYDRHGNLLYHKVGTGMVNSLAQSIAKLGDVNGDGCDDYIAGLGDPNFYGAVAVISGPTGQILRVVWGLNQGDYIGGGCTGCGDLDGDGLPDFAAGGGLSGSNGSVQAFSSRTGARLFACYSGYVGDHFGFVLRAADYDLDGVDDIIAASWRGMRVVSGREGTIIASHPVSSTLFGTFEAQPLHNENGFPQLLVRTSVPSTLLLTAAPGASLMLGQGCTIGVAHSHNPLLGMRELTGFDRRLTLSGAEPDSGAFLLLGLADFWSGRVSLAPLGLPHCTVYPTIAIIGFFATDSAGYIRHDFAVRSATAFGLGIDAQWVTMDGNGMPAALTSALRFAIRP